MLEIPKMKIAVPVTSSNLVDDHFGHCKFYNVFSISEENKITEIQIVPSVVGCGCKSNIATVLASDGVKILLAGGIGAGAIQVLNMAGIEVVRGCSGEAAEVVKQYLSGKIADSGVSCSHTHSLTDAKEGHQCSH